MIVTKKEAFRIVFDELNRWANERLKGKTAHNAECVEVEMKVNLGDELFGQIELSGVRDGDTPEEKLIYNIFTEETTNTLDFDSLEELLAILGIKDE